LNFRRNSSSSIFETRLLLWKRDEQAALFLSAPLYLPLFPKVRRETFFSLSQGENSLSLSLEAAEYLFFNFITLELIEYLLPYLLSGNSCAHSFCFESASNCFSFHQTDKSLDTSRVFTIHLYWFSIHFINGLTFQQKKGCYVILFVQQEVR